jgi:uncharacterized membrane protein YdjX (TVP38/TMEM64 family)
LIAARRALAVLGAVALAFVLWWSWNRGAMMAWKEEAGPLPFFAAMALLPAVGVPMTPFFVLAGATFGVTLALLGSGAALALNLVLCFAIARSGLRPRLEALLRRFGYELPDFEAKKTGAIRFALLVKLAPGAPAFAKNYLLGLTGVPFPVYFGMSMLFTGMYAALCIVLGVSLFEHDIERELLIGAAVVALALGLWWWRRRRSRAPEDGSVTAARETTDTRPAPTATTPPPRPRSHYPQGTS